MAQLKSTIEIEVDGVKDFLSTTEAVNKELIAIEKVLKKQGFKGNEKELKAAAKAYRSAMINAVKDIEVAEAARLNKVNTKLKNIGSSARGVGREALGVFIGGGLGETFGKIAAGLSDVIEKNKETDKEIGDLSKSLVKLQAGFAKVALTVLRFVARPLSSLINGAEAVSKALFGISFESEKASVGVEKLQNSFNSQIKVLKEGNLSTEARIQLIKDINSEYGEYLPNLLDENATLEDITKAQNAANVAFERKILLLASEEQSIDIAKRRLESLKEEITLQKQLSEAQERVVRFEGSTERAFQDAARVAANGVKIVEARIRANKENLAIIQKEKDLLDSVIEKEGIILPATVELKDPQEKPFSVNSDGTLDIDATINAKIKSDIKDLEGVASDIGDDITTAIDEGRLEDARGFITELETVKAQYDGINSSLGQAKQTQAELNRELAAQKGVTDESKDNIEDISVFISDILRANRRAGNLTEILDVGRIPNNILTLLEEKIPNAFDKANGQLTIFKRGLGISSEEADKIFVEVFNSLGNFTSSEALDALAKRGITAPVFELLEQEFITEKAAFEALTKASLENKEKIKEQGIEAAEKTKALDEDLLKFETAIADKRLKLQEGVSNSAAELFIKNAKLLSEIGESDLTDKFLAKIAEFANINAQVEAEIAKTAQSLANIGDDPALVRQLEQLLEQQTEALKNSKIIQKKELEDLAITFAEDELAAFNKRFKNEKESLENNLREQTLDLADAEAEREADRARFNRRAERDDREFNDKEINIIREHTEKILGLEDERLQTEKKLRVGAIVEALNDIEKRGGDAEVLLKKFNLDEREIILAHYKKVKDITDKGAIDTKESKKKAFLTEEEAFDLLSTTVGAFQDVFAAYISFQDVIAQNAINAIRDQLSNLDSEISNVTSKIDSLESDLEGKRSGRRDAILQSLDIQKEREEALVDKKIALEKKLRAEEKKASEARKSAAIAQALINAALAVTATWAGYAGLGIPGTILAGVQTAAIVAIAGLEIATIEAQQFGRGGVMEFAKGGLLDFGNSHADGGIPAIVGGQTPVEIEKGESIINKRSTAMYKPLLSAINEAGGGVKFANGGIPDANFDRMSQTLSKQDIRQLASIGDRPMYVSVTDIENQLGRKATVTDITSI